MLEAVAVQDGVQRIRLAVDEHVQALAGGQVGQGFQAVLQRLGGG